MPPTYDTRTANEIASQADASVAWLVREADLWDALALTAWEAKHQAMADTLLDETTVRAVRASQSLAM